MLLKMILRIVVVGLAINLLSCVGSIRCHPALMYEGLPYEEHIDVHNVMPAISCKF